MELNRRDLQYISALAQYNSEKRTEIRRYLESALSTNGKIESIEVIRNKSGELGNISLDEFEGEFLRRVLLLTPEDVIPQDHQLYLLSRYTEVENKLEMSGGFSPSSMLSFETLLHDEIMINRAESLDLLDRIDKPNDYQKHSDSRHIVEPPADFIDKWAACITFQTQEVFSEFVSQVVPLNKPEIITAVCSNVEQIFSFLSYPDLENRRNEYQFLLTPLFPVSDDEFIVPFPQTLLTTAQYRIEEYLSQNGDAQRIENQKKGKIVEELTFGTLSEIPSQNFIKEIHYIHELNKRESDGLLVFEDSYWAVEIKSHPLFRKVPSDIDKVRSRYLSKVKSASEQGFEFLEYLENSVSDYQLLYNLIGKKSDESLEKGTIVVLDGFLPTFYSDNERIDRQTGFGSIHEFDSRSERLFVVSLYDLYQLTQQPEIDQFEDFLKWRTGYDGNHPIQGFNEREYWAFYFDNYRNSPKMEDDLKSYVENDFVGFYISERFNSKSHLENIQKEENLGSKFMNS